MTDLSPPGQGKKSTFFLALKFLKFLTFRYCINSSSLDFIAETEVDESVKVEETEEIHHPATLGGCGVDGICKLPPKTRV